MLIVPKDQIQMVPGMLAEDACNFDFFFRSIKTVKNHKKNIQEFIEKRAQYSISNLKLPQVKELAGKADYNTKGLRGVP